MLARVQSFGLQGIDAYPCEVEVDIDETEFNRHATVVGLPDTAVRESIERVRSAICNAGYSFPRGTLLINLAPATLRKEGPVYDLPMAVGLLMAGGVINPDAAFKVAAQRRGENAGQRQSVALVPQTSGGGVALLEGDDDDGPDIVEPLDHRRYLFAGELALDGRVRPIRGAIAMATQARQRGLRGVVLPSENAAEAAVVEGIEVVGVSTLTEVVGILNGAIEPRVHGSVDVAAMIERAGAEVDFAEVRGQEAVKRAITVAAAGAHNLLMLGPAGTGKTMMAKALPGILPPLTVDEALEITRIYSAVGQVPGGERGGLVTTRPVRAPHHTASGIAIIGGGAIPKPGEISLAHRGVLFLDELPEFPRNVLDTLRQPLEDGHVTIARAHSAVRFPASFMLVAAMNPTAKGDMPTTVAGRREMERYIGRVSRPLIDRIDIHVEAPAVPWKHLAAGANAPKGTSSAQMRESVLETRRRQRERQGPVLNSRLRGRELDELAPMSEEARTMLGQAITELGLSARAYDKVRRVARTIADLEGVASLSLAHIAEAVQYRLLDRQTAA